MRRRIMIWMGSAALFALVAGVAAITLFPGSNATPSRVIAKSPIAKCMNLGNALEAPSEGEWGYRIRTQDMIRLRDAGFDTVRVPVKWSAHAESTAPYTVDPAIFQRVDQVATDALAAGLNVIVNVHHYEALMSDPETHELRLEAIWAQLSAHYADWPQGLMFEFINEPNGDMTTARVDALNARLLAEVRRDNPARWVIVGGAGWGNLEPLLASDPPRDPRVITTFHHYGPFEFTHQGATWTAQDYPTGVGFGTPEELSDIREIMRQAARFRYDTGLPVFLGEFGAIHNADLDDRAAWTRAMREAAEAESIGWCYWDFATSFKAYSPEEEAWIDPILDALIPRES